ncbi:uncharacterized protein MONOS_827 [Monocercomonoides exilis]|uniref:uncharacterized protein n=1 Tax=Monocercomonoides exilis TaxID=2049356 RepID=UPI0035594137|nr:hypothetical protein MONOS_827 [Monocercomonoides exilis]|eukprot:MONOS_827.1-p1 / transcript=MONOS_827.1 / gene=MONOS_827 / organism=Monocercomonoides_exilis_PA203 / gene_product=unspecified product / transcript_product=unspecified product / location=Mono_scaffold00013:226502-235105(-) / protein_length=2833 / sequence_SO=supercontig / SO=protein_coding / is_pseudo=false
MLLFSICKIILIFSFFSCADSYNLQLKTYLQSTKSLNGANNDYWDNWPTIQDNDKTPTVKNKNYENISGKRSLIEVSDFSHSFTIIDCSWTNIIQDDRFIVGQNGNITIQDCKFNKITMISDRPVIELKGIQRVIIEDTQFSETSRLSDGSVIDFDIGTDESTLDITKCNFTNCKSTAGCGGAISGTVGRGKLTITGCWCSTDSSRGGHCLLITNWNREKYPITVENFASLKGVTDNPKSILFTDYDDIIDTSFSVSEIPSSKECIISVYVDDSGNDANDGSEEKPKKTLDGAVSVLGDDDIVLVIESVELTEEWKICWKKLEICPSKNNSLIYVKISGTGSLVNDEGVGAYKLLSFSSSIFHWETSVTQISSFASLSLGSLSFESCNFVFENTDISTTYSDAMFSLLNKGEGKNGGKLLLNTVSVTGFDWSSNSFIKTTTGQLALTYVEFNFEGDILKKSSFICCERGTQIFSMKNCKFEDVSIHIGSGAKKNSMASFFSSSSSSSYSSVIRKSSFFSSTSSSYSSLNAGTEVSNDASNSPFIAINAADSVSIEGCTFSAISSSTSLSGGALSITIPSSPSSSPFPFLAIHNSSFSSCEASEANGRGGAIFLSLTGSSEIGANAIELTQLIFSGNKAAKGTDVYILYDHLKNCISDWDLSKTTKPKMSLNALYGCETSSPSGPSDEFSLYPFFYSFTDNSVYVDSSSGVNEDEDDACGYSQWPCSTLLKAMNHLSSDVNIVKIVTSLSVNAVVGLSGKSFSFQSSSSSKSSVEVAINSGFTCNTASASNSDSIAFNNLIFNLPSEGTPSAVKALFAQSAEQITVSSCNFGKANAQTKKNCVVNLAVLTGGIFTLQQTSIQSMSFSSAQEGGVIQASSGAVLKIDRSTFSSVVLGSDVLINSNECNSLSIEGSTFNDISSTSPTGTVGFVKMKQGNAFSVKSTSFSKCSGSSGTASASLYLQLDNSIDPSSLTDSPLHVEKLTFTKADGLTEEKETFIFVDAKNLKNIVSSSSFVFDPLPTDLNAMMGRERSTTNEELDIPLLVYLWSNFTSTGFVSDKNGGDFSGCGFSEAPCKTIKHILDLRFNAFTLDKSTVKVKTSFSIDEPLLLSSSNKKLSLESSEGESTVRITDTDASNTQQCFFLVGMDFSISKITLSIPENLNNSRSSLLTCSAQILSFQNSKIALAQSVIRVSYDVIVAEGAGCLNVDHLSMDNVYTVSGKHFIAYRAIDESSVSGVISFLTGTFIHQGESGIILIEGKSKCEIKNATLSHESDRDSSALKVKSGKSLTIDNCTFQKCKVNSANGGAILIEESKSPDFVSEIHINNCIFDQCETLAQYGDGGGIYAHPVASTNLVISSCIFKLCKASAEPTVTGYGGGIYLDLTANSNNFIISSPTFGEGDKVNSASFGKDLFASSASLKDSIKEQTLPFAKQIPIENVNSMRGFDGNDKDNAIPLVCFFHSYGDVPYVGEDGADVNVCGFTVYPCKTVQKALGKIESTEKRQVFVMEGAKIEGELAVEDIEHLIIGNSVSQQAKPVPIKQKLIIVNGGTNTKGIINAKVKCTFEYVSLNIPPSFGYHTSLIELSVPESNLILNNDDFVFSSECNTLIINALQGSVSITSCDLINQNLKSSILEISSSAVSGTIDNLIVDGITVLNSPLIIISPASSASVSFSNTQFSVENNHRTNDECIVSITNSNFTNIELSQNAGGCVISPKPQSNFDAINCIVNGTQFSSGTSSSDKGGEMLFTLPAPDGSLMIEDCSFILCCTSSNGRGGGLYLDCIPNQHPDEAKSPVLNFHMKSVNFSMNNAFYGKDFFIFCDNINEQVTNELFSLDYSQTTFKDDKAFCGTDASQTDINLLSLIRFYRSEQIFVSSSAQEEDSMCGTENVPCRSVSEGMKHINEGYMRFLCIIAQADLGGETVMNALSVRPFRNENYKINMMREYANTTADSSLIQTADEVTITLCDFAFGSGFESKHVSVFNQINGTTSITQCTFTGEDETVTIHSALFSIQKGRLDILKISISSLTVSSSLIRTEQEGNVLLSNSTVSNINANNGVLDGKQGNVSLERVNITNCNSNFSIFAFSSQSCGSLLKVKISTIEIKDGAVILINTDKNPDDISSHSSFSALQLPKQEVINHMLAVNALTVEHVKRTTNGACVISASGKSTLLSSSSLPYSSLSASTPFTLQFTNCTFIDCNSPSTKGSIASFFSCPDIQLHDCLFDGSTVSETASNMKAAVNDDKHKRMANAQLDDPEICTWQGSLLHLEQSSAAIEMSTLANSAKGGISITKSNATLLKSDFEGNKPNIPGFESMSRNIHCVGQESTLNVEGIVGSRYETDATTSSLWILNEECKLSGAAADRQSPFFIPSLKRATNRTTGDNREIAMSGSLLIPCDLSFRIIYDHSSSSEIVNHEFFSFVSETEAIATVPEAEIAEKGDKSVISVQLVFNEKSSGNPSYSTILMLQNLSKDDSSSLNDIISQSDAGGNTAWMIACIVCAAFLVLFVIMTIILIVFHRNFLTRSEVKITEMKDDIKNLEEKLSRTNKEKDNRFKSEEMPSTLLEGMTSQIPLLVEEELEELPPLPEFEGFTGDESNSTEHLDQPSVSSVESVKHSAVEQQIKMLSTKKPFRERKISDAQTLHSIIHSVQGDLTLGTRSMDVVDEKETVLAVAKLFAHLLKTGDERVQMMEANLCPFTIFIKKREEGENEVFVMAEEIEDDTIKNAMKRWKAPEENNENANEENERETDRIEKSVVFTLGLTLYEMIAGEEPLSECNTEEAQEMMRDGVRPLTEGIEGEEMVELMEKMWADEPNDRPFLDEVIRSLTSLIQSREDEN